MAYVIINPFFFFWVGGGGGGWGGGGNSFISNCIEKIYPNKYFNFGQLFVSSVVNIGELFV